MGQLANSTTIFFTSKTPGVDYSIENIVNYTDASGLTYILQKERVPTLLAGDVNIANNGMGGFAIS